MKISGLYDVQQVHLCLVLDRESEWVSVLNPEKMTLGHLQMSKAEWYIPVKEISGCFCPTS